MRQRHGMFGAPRIWLVSSLGIATLGGWAIASGGGSNSGPGVLPAGIATTTPAGLITPIADDLRYDLTKIMGPDACSECHAAEGEAWKKSLHSTTFNTTHSTDSAKEILSNMGLRSMKRRNELCLSCHYTSQIVRDSPKPNWGVSCESCHAPAQDWIDVHNDYGGTDKNRDNEDAAHRDQRYADCDAAGMLRPAEIYDIARNCFSCHTVPNEELVNTGGHLAGSEFELVSWTQGQVRHNYFYSEDGKNREASAERKRVLYVVGAMTDLEFSLRGFAKVTMEGDYQTAMRTRVASARERVEAILAANDLPDLKAAVPSADSEAALLVPNNGDAISQAADQISKATEAFAAENDGKDLGAIDSLLPGPDAYRGTAHE